jgi:hypothetical protein
VPSGARWTTGDTAAARRLREATARSARGLRGAPTGRASRTSRGRAVALTGRAARGRIERGQCPFELPALVISGVCRVRALAELMQHALEQLLGHGGR